MQRWMINGRLSQPWGGQQQPTQAHEGKKPEESKLRPGKRNISTSVRKLMMAWRLSGGWRESINPKTNTNIGRVVGRVGLP